MKSLSLLLFFLATCASAQTNQVTRPAPIVFLNVAVIDTGNASVQRNMTVVIIEDHIAEMGSAAKIKLPKNALVVEGRGKFVIPGLWDMHAHVLTDKAEILLPMLVANGVTGVREMGNDSDVPIPAMDAIRKTVKEGGLIGPYVLMAGHILDGPKPVLPTIVAIHSEQEARQTVVELKDSGVDFIKVYTGLPRGLYFAIADEAKKQGLPFVGHVPISVTAEEASDAGQKSFEHMTGVIDGCSRREPELRAALVAEYDKLQPSISQLVRSLFVVYQQKLLDSYDPQKASALFDHLRRNRTWQCPTLIALRTFAFFDGNRFLRDPRNKYIPRSWTFWTDPDRRHTIEWFKGLTDEDYANEKRAFEKRLEIAGAMHRANVEFLAGTDTAFPSVYPGFSVHEELALFVESGFSPGEALKTATYNPAKFLGMLDRLGTVEKGKLTDLVLLDANPLEDIHNTQRIRAVVLNGRYMDRAALDKLLADAALNARGTGNQ